MECPVQQTRLLAVVLAEAAVGGGDGKGLAEAPPLQQPRHPIVHIPRPPHYHILSPTGTRFRSSDFTDGGIMLGLPTITKFREGSVAAASWKELPEQAARIMLTNYLQEELSP